MMDIAPIPFGKRYLGPGHPTIIIAEIGINHEGSVNTCALMIEAAVRAGADAVKLQSADPDEHYMPGTESHAMYTRAALSREETAAMFALAKRLGVEVLTTCGDPPTMDFIETLEPAAHKISSGMLGHLPMIRRFARSGRPLLFSSGMAEIETIDAAVAAARGQGAKHLAVMQCVSLYPAHPEIMNLRVMHTFRERYQVPTGLSDHTLGTEVPTLAVAAGAHVIEKHFTLDRSRQGFDHGISLEAHELQSLVASVRRIEKILGDGRKALTEQEEEVRRRYGRRLVARREIPAGKAIDEQDITILRTPISTNGIPSIAFDRILGRVTRRAIARYEILSENDLT
jgi:sialic acid synthase SpsE